MNYKNYNITRFKENKDRAIVWKEIASYLQRFIKKDSSILDLGSGYCDFIKNIKAEKKYALDKYFDPNKHADPDTIKIFGDFKLLEQIKDGSLDAVFASNFFEHLDDAELDLCISLIKNKLKTRGSLIIIQPNYKYCPKNYFDDYTHKKAWTHISIKDYLESNNLSIKKIIPRFLPFSMKSKLPKNRFLIRLYLESPIKPFACQMLIISEKN